MSGTKPAFEDGERGPAPVPALTSAELLERELEAEPCWPLTRLVSLLLTAALAVGVLAPAAVSETHGLEWLTLLLPALLATLSARALFETIGIVVAGRRGLSTRRTGRHIVAAVIPALVATLVMAASAAVISGGFTLTAGVTTFALTVLTLAVAGAARDVEIRVRLSMRRVYFIGTAAARRDLERELSRRQDASLVGTAIVDSSADQLAPVVLNAAPTVAVLDSDAMRRPELVEVAATLNLAGVQIRDLVSYYESEFKKVPLGELSPTWFLFDIAPIHRRFYRLTRRSLELSFVLLLSVLSLPVLLLSAVAIRLTSRGPVLYRQRRIGRGGAEFTLVKLRTMRLADDPTAGWAGSHADRITPVGRFLRRFRLDELPQLWSAIRGDLALIGPRPEQVPIAERLERELPHYSARHCIRPGITGWAQVNLGYAGSVEGTIAKLQRDLYYIKHSSLRLDGLILWLTFKTVIAGRG